MAQTVDENLSRTLIASVLDELDQIDPQARPPLDEYAAIRDSPPAYNVFEEAHAPWRTADEVKQAIEAALDEDPALATAEKELKKAKKVLKEMKEKSQEAFKALRTKNRSSSGFSSLFSFGKSKKKPPQDRDALTKTDSAPSSYATGSVTQDGETNISQLNIGRSTSLPTGPTESAVEKFRQAHEAEANQDLVVRGLEEKAAEFKSLKEALSTAASTGNLAWMHLRRIAEPLSNTPELVLGQGELMEKLEGVENAYDVANKRKTDFSRACLAVQHSHLYFTHSLKVSDGIRHTSAGRVLLGGLGGMNEMSKMLEYRRWSLFLVLCHAIVLMCRVESVALAGKAQICLNEVFRVLEPHEDMIPEDRMEDYKALKKMGVMQMSKIYNLMYGGTFLDLGVSDSVKFMLEKQEAAFGHLTRLAVWIQDCESVCTMEEMASRLRDNVRRELAGFWEVNINRTGGAEATNP